MNPASIDTNIVGMFADIRNVPLTEFFITVTNIGGEAAVAAATFVAALFLWRSGKFAWAVGLLVSVGGAASAGYVIKDIVARARPDESLRAIAETGYSFPSLHATAAMALYGFLIAMLFAAPSGKRRVVYVWLLGILILLIGTSRLYLGVHYPSDVLAGYILGLAFVLAGVMTARFLAKDR
jgi:membrane-associated phospholipid phosphatase